VDKTKEGEPITVRIDDRKGIYLIRRDGAWERWDVRTATLYDTLDEALQAGCYRWRQPAGSSLVSAFLWTDRAAL
jgi:hypothetical protein